MFNTMAIQEIPFLFVLEDLPLNLDPVMFDLAPLSGVSPNMIRITSCLPVTASCQSLPRSAIATYFSLPYLPFVSISLPIVPLGIPFFFSLTTYLGRFLSCP